MTAIVFEVGCIDATVFLVAALGGHPLPGKPPYLILFLHELLHDHLQHLILFKLLITVVL